MGVGQCRTNCLCTPCTVGSKNRVSVGYLHNQRLSSDSQSPISPHLEFPLSLSRSLTHHSFLKHLQTWTLPGTSDLTYIGPSVVTYLVRSTLSRAWCHVAPWHILPESSVNHFQRQGCVRHSSDSPPLTWRFNLVRPRTSTVTFSVGGPSTPPFPFPHRFTYRVRTRRSPTLSSVGVNPSTRRSVVDKKGE